MESPSYYAVIPANVRYAAISPNAKLLFGEITCLCQQEGYCWASNAYLAKLYSAGGRSVARWIAELEEAHFIRVEQALNQHGQRKIYLADALPKVASQKWPAKNGTHNNTREYNTTSIEHPPTPKGEGVRFDEFWSVWPVHSRKVAKAQCLTLWRSSRLDALADEIIPALTAFKASHDWQKERGRFIPAPLVWLRQQRWQAAPALAPVTDDDEHPF